MDRRDTRSSVMILYLTDTGINVVKYVSYEIISERLMMKMSSEIFAFPVRITNDHFVRIER